MGCPYQFVYVGASGLSHTNVVLLGSRLGNEIESLQRGSHHNSFCRLLYRLNPHFDVYHDYLTQSPRIAVNAMLRFEKGQIMHYARRAAQPGSIIILVNDKHNPGRMDYDQFVLLLKQYIPIERFPLELRF